MTSHVKLYGSKSERFEEIKAELTEELGYEPSNPEVVGLLMAAYNPSAMAKSSVDVRRVS